MWDQQCGSMSAIHSTACVESERVCTGNVHVKFIGEPALQSGAILALTGPKVTHAEWQTLHEDLALCSHDWRMVQQVEDF